MVCISGKCMCVVCVCVLWRVMYACVCVFMQSDGCMWCMCMSGMCL